MSPPGTPAWTPEEVTRLLAEAVAITEELAPFGSKDDDLRVPVFNAAVNALSSRVLVAGPGMPAGAVALG